MPSSILDNVENKDIIEALDFEIKEAIAKGIKETPSIYIDGYYVPKIPSYEYLEKMVGLGDASQKH